MTRIRVGVVDPIIAAKPTASAFTRSSYLGAVASRADSFWVPDHLNSVFVSSLWKPEYVAAARIIPSFEACMEPWTMLGHIAGWNRVGRLPLGVGVTDTGRRNPAVTAQAAATLHLLTRGWSILGIGPGEREGNEPYGVEWSKPVARFEEAVATIRALWDSKGELVTRDSPYFPLRNASFGLPPYRGRWPEIWIGAHGPRMLRAAGRYADAYFPGFAHVPAEYARRLDAVRSAASDAGRDPMAITPALLIGVVAARNREDADAALDSPPLRAMTLGASDDEFARHGRQHPLGAGFAGIQDLLPQSIDEKTALELGAQVPPALTREVVLHGTPDEVAEQAVAWRDCGVRYFVLMNIGACQRTARKVAEATLAYYSVVRALKKLHCCADMS